MVNLGHSTTRIKCTKRSTAAAFQHRLLSMRGHALPVVQSRTATAVLAGPSISSLMNRNISGLQVHLS